MTPSAFHLPRPARLCAAALLLGALTLPTLRADEAATDAFATSAEGRTIARVVADYFATEPDKRPSFTFDPRLDEVLRRHPAAIRALAWAAWREGWERGAWRADVEARRVANGNLVMPYALREVGARPPAGWGVFIPMHGGGADKASNDKSFGRMQHRYADQPPPAGYLYVTPRAPTDAWNGFYTDGNLILTDRLLKQLRMFHDVDPNRIYLCGYSHGGYGAFFQGTRIADHFAHVHASSAAPTEYDASGLNLRTTHFTYMIDAADVKHDRRQRCEWFDKWIAERRGGRTDIFPVVMEPVSGFGHGRVPDQAKLKDMLPHVRDPLPQEISWFVWPPVTDFYWLRAPQPQKVIVEARRDGNRVTITTERPLALEVLLDERIADLAKPVQVVANGVERTVEPRPTLETLCETLAARGDPDYAFTVRIPVPAAPPSAP